MQSEHVTVRIVSARAATDAEAQQYVVYFLCNEVDASTKAIIGCMPRKVRELVQDLQSAGFYTIPGGGKGSHRKFTHEKYAGVVTLSGKSGDDSKPYQERQVQQAIEQVKA